MTRIRLNPNPSDGGGNPAPPPAPDFARPPAGGEPPRAAYFSLAGASPSAGPEAPPAPPTPAPPPDVVTLPRSEYERYHADRLALETLQRQQAEAIERARLEAAQAEAARGEQERAAVIERLTAERAAEVAQVREQYLASERGRVVSAALAAPPTPYASEAAARHVAMIVAADVEAVHNADGTVSVRDRRTGRPAAEAIAERLASPEFAHFLRPSSAGGSGSTAPGGPPASGGAPPSYANRGEAALAEAAALRGRGLRDPAMPVGMGRFIDVHGN